MSTDRSLKNQARAIAVLTLTAVFATTSCSGTRSSGASSDPSTAATTPSSPGAPSNAPGVFTSAAYGYSVRVPARWTSTQATSKWNGQSGLDIEAPQVDKFHSPTTDPAFWAVATPWRQSLAAFASFAISWTSSFHGDSCTALPAKRDPITIGGQPGVLLAYDCGILINDVVTVHNGVGYWFVFRDARVAAATNPADHATFTRLLKSVRFPA